MEKINNLDKTSEVDYEIADPSMSAEKRRSIANAAVTSLLTSNVAKTTDKQLVGQYQIPDSHNKNVSDIDETKISSLALSSLADNVEAMVHRKRHTGRY